MQNLQQLSNFFTTVVKFLSSFCIKAQYCKIGDRKAISSRWHRTSYTVPITIAKQEMAYLNSITHYFYFLVENSDVFGIILLQNFCLPGNVSFGNKTFRLSTKHGSHNLISNLLKIICMTKHNVHIKVKLANRKGLASILTSFKSWKAFSFWEYDPSGCTLPVICFTTALFFFIFCPFSKPKLSRDPKANPSSSPTGLVFFFFFLSASSSAEPLSMTTRHHGYKRF